MRLYAHSKEGAEENEWQTLADHLQQVEILSSALQEEITGDRRSVFFELSI